MPGCSMPLRLSIAVVFMAFGALVGCDRGAEPAPPATATGAAKRALPYGLTPEQASAPVLRLSNGVSVSLGEVAARLGPPPRQRNRPPETERRREFVAALVDAELLAAEAMARGDVDKPVAEVRQAALVQVATDRLFGPEGELVEPVTDAVVRAAYEAQLERFTAPQRRRVSHILIGSEDAARLLLQQLQAAPDLRQAFGDAALRQSYDLRTRGVRGDLGYFKASEPPPPEPGSDATARPSMRLASQLPQPIREAAFRIGNVGELLPELVQTDRGYHLLLLTGKEGGQRIPFEQVQRALEAELLEQHRDAALQALTAKLEQAARPQYHEANLELLRVP
jgi:peptidyl-prolyl cis-trans isomerase C